MHLFTYGTLMFPEVWRIIVCPDHSGKDFETTPATLPGYEIRRVHDAVYPGIIISNALNSDPRPPASSAVPGLLYFELDPASVARLDRFEGDDYRRASVQVTTPDHGEITADTYIIPPENRHLLTDELWTPAEFQKRGDLARFVAKYEGFSRLD